MKRIFCTLSASLGLFVLGGSAMAADGIAMQEQYSNLPYFPKERLPIKKVAVSAMNVKLGVHLERLSLVSGEGHSDKKLTAGLLAGAATLLGGVGGADFAEKEPLEDHLPAADAQVIANEIGKMLTVAVEQSGLELVPAKVITSAPGYAAIEGDAKITTDTENIKGNLFKPSYFFGYQQVPIMGYKFRKKHTVLFGAQSDEASTRVRELANVPMTLAWTVSVVNDRKVMRVRELTLTCFGQGAGPMSSGDDKVWATVSIDPDSISTPSGESHKNLEYWAALSPKLAEATKTMMKRVSEKLATAGS
jgi:hypothetical protein